MTMRHDLEQDYFKWLCEKVNVEQEDKSYWLVAKDLHRKAFIAIIDRDENRELDGLELRQRYLDSEWYTDSAEIEGECSVLEMLIALAERMDFQTSGVYSDEDVDRTSYWFWEMLDNLGLTSFDDESYVELDGQIFVEKILDDFIDREYDSNGVGGIFPLNHAEQDQRDVEIWYQMSAYLYEKEAG